MTQYKLFAGAALSAIVAATAVQAQGLGTRPQPGQVQATIGGGLADQIEDIEIRTQREIAAAGEDEFRLGAVPQGFRGAVSLTGFASFGNNEDIFIGAAGRFTIGQGNVAHSFSLGGEYTEADGESGNTRVLGLYDLNVNFTEQFYGFGIVRGQYNEDDILNEWDVFAGVGPGIRLINRPDVSWRIQAGPGVRFTRAVADGDENWELAGILASRASFRVASDVFVTNDTDLLYSDNDTLVSNDLALNSRISGPLSARVGLRTDWRSDSAPGQDSTENRVTLGVVYSFQ